jgi:tetratricopeptide (TPR) repeat protein
MRSRHTLLGLCTLALCLGSGSARADQDRADAHFRDGSQAFDAGDFRRAAEAFARADRLAPHGVAKYSAALASKAAGDRVTAHDQFQAALASGQLSAGQASECRAQLAELDSQLARLTVHAPPGTEISVAHIERGKTPLSVRLEPGHHEVSAVFPDGRVEPRRIEARAGTEVSVELEATPARARAP